MALFCVSVLQGRSSATTQRVRRQAGIEQVVARSIFEINTSRPKNIDFDKSESRKKAPAA